MPRHPPDDPAADAIGAPPPRVDIVTASALVRHFGLWQRRATTAPVYVLYRGRPRLVLTSIEVMETLLAPRLPGGNCQAPEIAPLLELIRDMVVIGDHDLRITAASRTARNYFGQAVAIGLPLDTVAPAPARAALRRTLRHVQVSGVHQYVDIASPHRAGLPLTIAIDRFAGGLAISISDPPPR
ncbi:PAS domain-containing protein [Sphingomonas qilianensis]